MKLLGTAFFFLAVLCVCTVGEDGIETPTAKPNASTATLKAAVEPVTTTTSQTITLAVPVPTTAVKAADENITISPMSSSPNATSQTTQGTTEKPPAVTSVASTSLSTTNTTQASGTQSAENKNLDAASTTGQSFSSTVSPERNTSASGTSGLPMSSPTSTTKPTSESPKSSSGNQTQTGSDINYSNVILPVVITLIVITLSVFSLVALYKMCQKKTPERQENGAEQAQSGKEGVKLLSVKTTSSETGEHSSHGKNKTRQLFTSQQ
ncbi:endomucin isoform X1 [Poecile atricapillus]|uniref:endomucin isoform X1 n=1 Tax=Poecile atricapillus TaxID=48891 RepID=UPI0027388642|nr:endomucin isoform X1 [Poecile atricapillus]